MSDATGLTAAAFAAQFLEHLPSGEIWPRDLDATQAQILGSLMGTYARLAGRDRNLLVDAFPQTTRELLPEWEASVGLPDPCTPLNATIEQRVGAVVARVIGGGGQSIAHFVAVANALGYSLTASSISEFGPFRASRSTAGQPLYNANWANAWQIASPLHTVNYFLAGGSAAGDPLATWSNTQLECEIRRIAPAHAVLTFAYF